MTLPLAPVRQLHSSDPGAPTALLTDTMTDPPLTGSLAPGFSWQVNDPDRGEYQTAYRIIVASSRTRVDEDTGDVWDSGKVASSRSTAVPYRGRSLASNTRYWWKVRMWNKNDNTSPFSAVATFDTGLFPEDWTASYIWDGTDNVNNYAYFRKSFAVLKPVAMAKLYISAHDDYVLFVNGRETGRGPARNDPLCYGQYNAYDITRTLIQGDNAIAVIGHWHGLFHDSGVNAAPALITELRIRYEDGSTGTIVSDPTWRTLAATAWLEDPFTTFGGGEGGAANRCAEQYDARLEPIGWREREFDDSGWSSASVVDRDAFRLFPQLVAGQIEVERIVPLSITPTGTDWIVDFGECICGWPELTMTENARGDTVTVSYFQAEETIGPAGWDRYLCRGGTEIWKPDIGHCSFRTLRISGYAGHLTAGSVGGIRAHTAADRKGSFESSDPILNSIYEMCERSARQNVQQGIVSVDANREQAQWTADAWIVGNVLLYNHRNSMVVRKVILDFAGEQTEDGNMYAGSPGRNSRIPEWALYWPMLLWQQYLFYGDEQLLAEVYPNLQKLLEYFEGKRNARTRLLHDTETWEITDLPNRKYIDQTGAALTAQNCQYFEVLRTASRIAAILARPDEAATYSHQADEVRGGINRYLYQRRGRYRDSLRSRSYHQLPATWALRFDIPPPEKLSAVVEHVKSLGFEPNVYGADCFFDAMYHVGESRYLYDLLTEPGKGRWEWMAANNGRVCTENWHSGEWNHAWSSSPGYFLQKHITGVVPTGAGFSTFDIHPAIDGGLTWAASTIPTIKGDIATRWEILPGDAGLRLTATVPANTVADIYIPAPESSGFRIEEGGRLIWRYGVYLGGVPGIERGEEYGDSVRFEVGSGSYVFTVIPEGALQ